MGVHHGVKGVIVKSPAWCAGRPLVLESTEASAEQPRFRQAMRPVLIIARDCSSRPEATACMPFSPVSYASGRIYADGNHLREKVEKCLVIRIS
jgi:hypothetical protein